MIDSVICYRTKLKEFPEKFCLSKQSSSLPDIPIDHSVALLHVLIMPIGSKSEAG